jgi:hypothetical protein
VALCQARTSTKPLWGLSSSNPYHPSHVPNSIIIFGDIHTFTSLGVFGEYAKSLFASSPLTHKSFSRILHRRLNTFRAFSVGV